MRFILTPLFFLAIFLLLSKPTKAEFVTLKKDKQQDCSFKLNGAKNLVNRCKVITDSSNSLAVWQNRLSFEFGKLSESEFNYLINTYSGWSKSKTAVTYDRDRHYQLIDFLPPLIQALDSHRFVPESIKLDRQRLNLNNLPANTQKQLYANCWGVAYEVLRMARDPQVQPAIFMGQGSIMLDLLRDNSKQLLALKEPEDSIPQAITQPGDIILIMHQSSAGREYLDHVAIAIDDGIYFEKAGTGAEVPIRIIDEQTIRQIWQPGVFYYEVRRPKTDAIFPHPQTVFSLNSSTIEQEFYQLNTIPDNIARKISIMRSPEAKNLATSSWFAIVNTLPIYIDSSGKAKLTPLSYKHQTLLRSTID